MNGHMLTFQGKQPASLPVAGFFLGMAAFVMSVGMITVANTGSSVFNEETGTLLYYVCIPAWTLGFLAYAWIDRFVKTAFARQAALISAAVLCVLAFSNITFAYSKIAYAPLSLLFLFLFGILYAAVYHKTALRLNGSPYTGRVFGISVAGIELVIWPVTSLIANAAVTYASVAAALVLILFYVRRPPRSAAGVRREQKQPVPGRQGRTMIALVIAAALIGVMVGMTEQIYMSRVTEGDIKMQDWPRLFHAISILAMGFLADIKKRRYLPLTTFCIMMLFSVGVMLWEDHYPVWVAMCVYYAFRATGIVFFSVSFLDLAPKTKNPGLWAAMGRFATAPVESVLFFAISFLRPSLLGMIILSLFSTVLLFLALWWGRLFVPQAEQAQDAWPRPSGPALDEAAAAYGITNREVEALRLLLTNKSTRAIAEEMCITEKTVQKYISSMMSKTNVESRSNLLLLFSRTNP
jgi:DNA-binding CsgD family transcriptional regulator